MAEPLKHMVDRDVVEDIAARVRAVDAGFDDSSFVEGVMPRLAALELKARIEAIARGLRDGLDPSYPAALDVVVAVARDEPPVDGFAAWSLCTFVELFGLADPEVSLAAMEHLTRRASCEFAIRPFLAEHWDLAYARLERYTAHSHEAVRRLPSEGTRPRLPWATSVPRLRDDPTPGLRLLEPLRHDPSATVRRSVANHLNDVAKDHPAVVVETTARWSAESLPVEPRLVAHALRTLVKQGDRDALTVLGLTTDPAVEVVDFTVTPGKISMGQRIELAATLRSTSRSPQRLVVDLVIHHVTATGATTPKVFKWATVELGPGEQRTIGKRRLVQQMSTRTYHRGTHRVELQVAGTTATETTFEIVEV